MPVATNVSSSIPQPRSMPVRRKPAPSIVLDARYPCPDPDDPFAPLSVLRTRTASTLGLLTFTGDSTAQLPTLPYTGGTYPPDPYQAMMPPASPDTASPTTKLELLTTLSTRSSFDISQNLQYDTAAESGRWPPQFTQCDSPSIRTLPTPQRRRSRSAVSRKEARTNTCSVSPGTSPYGHTNLQAYVLASSRFPSPSAHSAQPFQMQHIGHGSESVLPLVIPITRHDSAPVLSLLSDPSSRMSTFSSEQMSTSRSRVGKFARFLPRKSRSGLSLAEFSSETGNVKHHQHHRSFPTMAVALGTNSERPSKEKHVPEENTFRPRRKSSMSMLFPAHVAANMQSLDVSHPTGTSIYDSPTSVEPGYMSEPSSSTLYPPSTIVSGISEPAPLTPKKPRPQTMQPQQRLVDVTTQPPRKKPSSRPSTAPSSFAHVFDENALPTKRQLLDAASCVVVAENGIRVPFGDLFRDQKTVVIFIRHFWCPLCQDYMFSIANTVDPQVLKQSGINLVIISNGSFNMIKSYRQIFRTPYAVYTDPSSRIYSILGMTMKSVESKAEQRRSSYVRHSRAGGIAMVIANALRVGMPVWEKAGNVTQLGGEFVLGPGMTASYAHRMRSRSSHAPIVRVLTAAGVHVYLRSEKPKPVVSSDPAGRASIVLEADEEQWMEERRQSLARIRERKQARRLGVSVPPSSSSTSSSEQDTGRRIRHVASHMTRTDSIAEEDEEYVIPILRPKAGATVTGSSPLRGADADESSDSAEDDTDDSSVDTRSIGSDIGSEKGHVGLSDKPGAVEFIHDLSPPIPLLI